jgi:hypothetical protein
MSKVFIGGSRRISRLNADLVRRLEQVIENRLTVLVGDANGADKAVQEFLKERQYRDVSVFCTGGHCRNNLAAWPVTAIAAPHRTRDFDYFSAKDAAMAKEADYGLMLWDGRSAGTIVNVARLVRSGKQVVLYLAPARRFVTLRSKDDLGGVLAASPPEIRRRVEGYVSAHFPDGSQTRMF